jgi:SAM-dependent methyltransferase
VQAIDSPQLVRALQAIGCDVRIALTDAAAKFVAFDALAALVHRAVWRDLWSGDAATPVPHVNLAEWADLVVVYPASATTLSRIATGDCSDLVSAIVCATRAPVVIAPSMNDAMYGSPAVQANLATLRDHGRWLVHPSLGVEVAHAPSDRRSIVGPAPPPAAMLDVIRHLLSSREVRPQLPADAAGWERLWSSTPLDRMPWHADAIDGALADALDARCDPPGRRLIDVGTGAGTVAIDAARRGFAVTATDVSATALGRARQRAGDLPILFVLDDVTAPRLGARFDVAVDCGLLHCLPRERWPDYARAVTDLVAPGGSLLLMAHRPGVDLATTPITDDDLRALLPAFVIAGTRPAQVARADATLFDLQRKMGA